MLLHAAVTQNAVLRAHIIVLIFEAEDHIDQRALVNHVVEAAADIPAVIARCARLAKEPGPSQAVVTVLHVRPLEIGRSPTTGRENHKAVPSIAQPRADRE